MQLNLKYVTKCQTAKLAKQNDNYDTILDHVSFQYLISID